MILTIAASLVFFALLALAVVSAAVEIAELFAAGRGGQ
jgi:hypothetical protein